MAITPSVWTYDAWLNNTSTKLINIEVWALPGWYLWPFGQAWIYAQVREAGAAGWEDKSAILMTSPSLYKETFLHYASDRDIDVEVRGAVKYKGSLGSWKYIYGDTITIHIPATDADPYVNTGSVYPLNTTTIRAWAHGWPGNYDNNEIWVQYRKLGDSVWIDTSKTSATKNTLTSIYKDITVDTSVDYEFRAALSYNAGAATVYGEIEVCSTDDEPDSLECETKPSGAGTEANPYIITDLCELNWIGGDSVPDPKAARLTAWYEVGNDIDASETAQWYWNPERGVYEGFRVIGNNATSADRFNGKFDGKDYEIRNLFINRNTNYVGLFGYLYTPGSYTTVVKNVNLIDVDITGKDNVGALAGIISSAYGWGSWIYDCYSSGIVRGVNAVGGLLGIHSAYVNTFRSGSSATIRATGSHIGGFAGSCHPTVYTHVLEDCFATGNVYSDGTTLPSSAGSRTGGFTGSLSRCVPRRCFATGNVVAHDVTRSPWGAGSRDVWAGGFVGYSHWGTENCYARGNVSFTVGDSRNVYVGGFAGQLGTQEKVYSTGAIVVSHGEYGNRYISGLTNSSAYNSFWDVESSGIETSTGGTGRTTAVMKDINNFLDAGWDFVTIWAIDPAINDGYPYLQALLAELTVTTLEPTDVDTTQFNSRGEITSASPNAYRVGFGYFKGAAGDPDEEDDAVYDEGDFGVGIFAIPITGLSPGESYRVRAFAINTSKGLVWGNTITVVLVGGDVYPTDAMARVSSVRRIYKPGIYRMEIAFGDLGFDMDVAELGVRKVVGDVEEPKHPSTDEPLIKYQWRGDRPESEPKPPAERDVFEEARELTRQYEVFEQAREMLPDIPVITPLIKETMKVQESIYRKITQPFIELAINVHEKTYEFFKGLFGR